MNNTELLPCPFYVVVIDEVPYVFSNLKDAENFTFGYKYPQRILRAQDNTRADKADPVERIVGLAEAIEWQNGKYCYYKYRDEFNHSPHVAIDKAARAYLALQGGD